ncbi:MAG: hypothetical protein JNN12_14620 [Bacteroidetes Order II. Incertae sedis bacterium]|nr:hypothetical protein [Bacteroidetes Order II. bacterium]
MSDCVFKQTPHLRLEISDETVVKSLLPPIDPKKTQEERSYRSHPLVARRPGKAELYLHYTKLYPRKYHIGRVWVSEKPPEKP